MRALDRLHASRVFPRRVRVLAELIAPLLPAGAAVLDVGCGDGAVAAGIAARRPDVAVCGVDVLVRSGTRIPVAPFDGRTLPFGDGSFGAALLVDVLHHAADPRRLLAEAGRVAPLVVVKDHVRSGLLAAATLRFMDSVGNRRHGVALPYRYFSEAEWRDAIAAAGLAVRSWTTALRLYPYPADWVFGRRLHVFAVLARPEES
jgi:SAM-dependent methyltransferase